jgi:hypothetical protein
LGALALAAVLAMFGGSRWHSADVTLFSHADSTVAADGVSVDAHHAVVERLIPSSNDAAVKLAVAAGAVAVAGLALVWSGALLPRASDVVLGALGVRWRRRGPPHLCFA